MKFKSVMKLKISFENDNSLLNIIRVSLADIREVLQKFKNKHNYGIDEIR